MDELTQATRRWRTARSRAPPIWRRWEAARGIAAMVDALAMFAANPMLPAKEANTVLARLKFIREGIGILD